MKLFYFIRRFWEIPGVERYLFIRGTLFATLIRIVTWICPLKYYSYFLNLNQKTINSIDDKILIHNAKITLKRITILFPFAKKCLVKVITIKLLLNESGIKSKMILALKKDNGKNLHAHAYLVLSKNRILFKDSKFVDLYSL